MTDAKQFQAKLNSVNPEMKARLVKALLKEVRREIQKYLKRPQSVNEKSFSA